jgi:hypothetical protein
MFFVEIRRFTLRVKVGPVVTIFQSVTHCTFVNLTRYNTKKNLLQGKTSVFYIHINNCPIWQCIYIDDTLRLADTHPLSIDNCTKQWLLFTKCFFFIICVIFDATHRTRLPDENFTTMCAIKGINAPFVSAVFSLPWDEMWYMRYVKYFSSCVGQARSQLTPKKTNIIPNNI